MLHNVMASSAIKYAGLLHCLRLPLPDTEHPEILSSSPSKRRWSVKLKLLSGRQSSYSTPSTLSSAHSQFKPFRSWQNLGDRQIPTHTLWNVFFLSLLRLLYQRSDKVLNKVCLRASKETRSEIIFFLDCSRSVR